MMRLLLLLLAFLVLSGCSLFSWNSGARPYQTDSQLVATTHQAVDQLLAAIPAGKGLDRKLPLLVASAVNVDDLTSSRLGRTMAEQFGSRLATHGYAVIELKLRDSIFVKQGEGELLLSREVKELSRTQQAQAVLVATYAQSLSNVYVTLKLVGAGDSQIIAAHDFALPVDAEVRSLLWKQR